MDRMSALRRSASSRQGPGAVRRDVDEGEPALRRSVLQLQGAIGNAAVQRILRSRLHRAQDAEWSGTNERGGGPEEMAPADQGEERLTEEEWLGKVRNGAIYVSEPFISFRTDNSMLALPAKTVTIR